MFSGGSDLCGLRRFCSLWSQAVLIRLSAALSFYKPVMLMMMCKTNMFVLSHFLLTDERCDVINAVVDADR